MEMSSEWFSGRAEVTTYALEELLGTKLSALYQRKKGRDLFDLWYVHKNLSPVYDDVFTALRHYLKMQGVRITKGHFLINLKDKMNDPLFLRDIRPLLRSGIHYDLDEAFAQIEHLVEKHYSDS